MTASSDHEQLLEDLVTGSVSPDSDRVVQLFRERPELRLRWEEMKNMGAGFDELGRMRAEVLDEVVHSTRENRVVVRDVLASRLPKPPSQTRPRFPWWITTAAAAILACGLWLGGIFDRAPDLPPILGNDIVELWPERNVKGRVEFRWTYELSPGGWYTLSVHREGKRLTHVPHLTEPRWVPGEEDVREWKGTLRWQVEAYRVDATLDATGTRVIEYEPE